MTTKNNSASRYDKEYSREYYLRNQEKIKAKSTLWRQNNPEKVKVNAKKSQQTKRHKEYNKRISKILNDRWIEMISVIKLSYGCQNTRCQCKGEFIAAELEFHHIDPDSKAFGITQLRKRRASLIANELNKCCVLCSNCHRRLHYCPELVSISGRCDITENMIKKLISE